MSKMKIIGTSLVLVVGALIIAGCIEGSPIPEGNISKTEEWEVKSDLVEKYEPGTCFGMPGPVTAEQINKTMENNPELVEYIKYRFNTTQGMNIHTKVTQFNNIQLNETEKGYNFTLKDGNCCKITIYHGEIILEDGEIGNISTKDKTTKNVPC